MKKLLANGSWQIENILYYLLILFLPTQLGKHFWPDFAYVHGLRIDYLSPTVYFTDILILLIFILWLFRQTIFNKQNSNIKYLNSKQYQNPNTKIKKSFEYLKIKKWNLFRIWNLACLPARQGFGIFLVYLLANVYLSDRIWGGAYSLLKLAEMSFLAYYTAKFISDKARLSKTILALGVSLILESAIAIFQFLKHASIGGPLYFLGERTFNSSTPGIANASISGELILRPYGTFSHPNVLAGYLVILMTLVLFSLNRHCEEQSDKANSKNRMGLPRSFQSLAMTCCLILGSIALFLTLSRVAILVWILILFNYLIKYIHRHPGKRSALRISKQEFSLPAGRDSGPIRPAQDKQARMTKRISIPVAVIGVVALFFLTPLGSRFTNLNLADEAVVKRQDLISAAVKMLEVTPLLGVGLGNFIPTLASFQTSLTVGINLQPVHNIFLLVASETGLIGLGFFVWLLWKTYKMANGKWQMANGLHFCFLAILILGIFDHYWLTLQQGQLLFAFITGISFSNFKKNAHKSS